MTAPSPTSATASSGKTSRRHAFSARWVPWLLGAALFAAVIFMALHFSEGRDFAEILQRAKPRWLLLALLLQAATYSAQGEVFRIGPSSARVSLSRRWLFQLSFGKLFLDQALPSGGISSTALISASLEQQGVQRKMAVSAAVINIISYYAAYVVALATALVFAGFLGGASLIVLLTVLFVAFSAGVTTALLLLSGRRRPSSWKPLRLPVLKDVLKFLEEADPAPVRNPRLLGESVLWQLAIFLLDAATMWVLIRSLGASAPAGAVFASFMFSSLFRTMGISPGGLGTYEAASIFTLRMIGLSFPVALSATLLFRGLTFWLPMLPGLWFSRRVTRSPIARSVQGTGASE
jgi:uncharacterized membrane protein YbhN (UPF0104 family)